MLCVCVCMNGVNQCQRHQLKTRIHSYKTNVHRSLRSLDDVGRGSATGGRAITASQKKSKHRNNENNTKKKKNRNRTMDFLGFKVCRPDPLLDFCSCDRSRWEVLLQWFLKAAFELPSKYSSIQTVSVSTSAWPTRPVVCVTDTSQFLGTLIARQGGLVWVLWSVSLSLKRIRTESGQGRDY